MNAKVTGVHGELRCDNMISGHREIEGYSNENHKGDRHISFKTVLKKQQPNQPTNQKQKKTKLTNSKKVKWAWLSLCNGN